MCVSIRTIIRPNRSQKIRNYMFKTNDKTDKDSDNDADNDNKKSCVHRPVLISSNKSKVLKTSTKIVQINTGKQGIDNSYTIHEYVFHCNYIDFDGRWNLNQN